MTHTEEGVYPSDINSLSRRGAILDRKHRLPDCIRTIETREGLANISEPATELVILGRSLPYEFQEWLEELDASQLPHLRILIEPDELRAAIEPRFHNCGMASGEMQDLLIGDIEALVSAFSAVTQSSLVVVRLDRISHDACWKFHRDTVETRLLTTYRGPATEWVLPEHAARALREQKKFTGPIGRLRDHDVALFKGSEAGTGRGIVHRSPPIVGTGCTRLLLCLNLPSDVSPEQYSKYP